jgi:hypothetical protein
MSLQVLQVFIPLSRYRLDRGHDCKFAHISAPLGDSDRLPPPPVPDRAAEVFRRSVYSEHPFMERSNSAVIGFLSPRLRDASYRRYGRHLEIDRSVLSWRQNSVEAKPERGNIAAQRQFNRLPRQRFRLPVQKCLHGKRHLIARPFWTAIRVAGLTRLEFSVVLLISCRCRLFGTRQYLARATRGPALIGRHNRAAPQTTKGFLTLSSLLRFHRY